jgi:Terminase large subunit, T4likevirus-type, N-terminal
MEYYQYWKDTGLPPDRLITVPMYSTAFSFRDHRQQILYFNSTTRFTLAAAGRRSGKSEIAIRRLFRRALGLPSDSSVKMFYIGAPTYDQVRLIYWDKLKALVPDWMIDGKPNETRLYLTMMNGATIRLIGLDKAERMEGGSILGIIIDEFGNVDAGAWENNIKPALADTGGFADLLGVPLSRRWQI